MIDSFYWKPNRLKMPFCRDSQMQIGDKIEKKKGQVALEPMGEKRRERAKGEK